MKAKSFGKILILVGIAISFIMFAFSEWNVNNSFIENIRYAYIFGERCTMLSFHPDYDECMSSFKIQLGQGLIFPIVLILIGFAINKGILEEELIMKVLPFIDKDTNE